MAGRKLVRVRTPEAPAAARVPVTGRLVPGWDGSLGLVGGDVELSGGGAPEAGDRAVLEVEGPAERVASLAGRGRDGDAPAGRVLPGPLLPVGRVDGLGGVRPPGGVPTTLPEERRLGDRVKTPFRSRYSRS